MLVMWFVGFCFYFVFCLFYIEFLLLLKVVFDFIVFKINLIFDLNIFKFYFWMFVIKCKGIIEYFSLLILVKFDFIGLYIFFIRF